MKKPKFYVPGLLSLCVLFPLLMYKLSQWGIFHKDYVLEVMWYNPIATPYSHVSPLPSRNYTLINLTGEAADDNIKIQYAKLLVKEMVHQFDTTRGVRIHFADTAKYESFIEVLDFCSQQDALGYAPHENDFWIFNRFKGEEEKNLGWLGSCIVYTPINTGEEKNEMAWAYAYTFDKKFWPLAVLFITLSVLSFRRRMFPTFRKHNIT
jgi:hypothetical protein